MFVIHTLSDIFCKIVKCFVLHDMTWQDTDEFVSIASTPHTPIQGLTFTSSQGNKIEIRH